MTKTYQKIAKQIGFSYGVLGILFLLSPLLIIILTRSLTIKEYGIYSLLAVTIYMAGALLDFGLSQYMVAKLAGIHPERQKNTYSFLFKVLFITLLALILIILFTPLMPHIISLLNLNGYTAPFILMLGVIFCVTLVRFCISYFSMQKRLILAQSITLSSQGLWIVLIGAMLLAARTIDLTATMLCWLVGTAATLIFCIWISRKGILHPSPDKRSYQRKDILKESVIFSAPLMLFLGATWIVEAGGRYMINSMIGPEPLAHYALIYSLIGIIATTSIVIFTAFFPYLATAWNQKKNYGHYLNAMVKYSLMICIPGMAGFLVMGKEIISLVSGVEYLVAVSVVPALLLYPLFNVLGQITYQLEVLRKRTLFLGLVYVAGAAVNIALNFIFISKWGIFGAGVSTTITYALIFFVLAIDTRSVLKVDFRFIRAGRIILASICMGLIIMWVHPLYVWSKLLTMGAGAIIYMALIALSGVITPEEKAIVGKTAKNVLHTALRSVKRVF